MSTETDTSALAPELSASAPSIDTTPEAHLAEAIGALASAKIQKSAPWAAAEVARAEAHMRMAGELRALRARNELTRLHADIAGGTPS